MDAPDPTDRRPVLIVGSILVLGGIAALTLRLAGVDVIDFVGESGWPLFVIVPGLILLAASLFPAAPSGVGFAIAGSIVTVVGLLLLYQQSSGHWESWAYAWALVGPGGAGLGLLAYGLLFRQRDLVTPGLWLVAIAAVLFTVGFWFFETVFDSGRVPADLETWWPVAFIGAGVIVLLAGFFGTGRRQGHD